MAYLAQNIALDRGVNSKTRQNIDTRNQLGVKNMSSFHSSFHPSVHSPSTTSLLNPVSGQMRMRTTWQDRTYGARAKEKRKNSFSQLFLGICFILLLFLWWQLFIYIYIFIYFFIFCLVVWLAGWWLGLVSCLPSPEEVSSWSWYTKFS